MALWSSQRPSMHGRSAHHQLQRSVPEALVEYRCWWSTRGVQWRAVCVTCFLGVPCVGDGGGQGDGGRFWRSVQLAPLLMIAAACLEF